MIYEMRHGTKTTLERLYRWLGRDLILWRHNSLISLPDGRIIAWNVNYNPNEN
jgi:hypothetical protein